MVQDLERSFFKGVSGHWADGSFATDEQLREASVYYWWWQFARANPVFWHARTSGAALVNPTTLKSFKALGDLKLELFEWWWGERGFDAFREPRELKAVREIKDLKSLPPKYKDEKTVLLHVSMIVNKETILNEIKDVLKDHHPGKGLEPIGFSGAELKLYTLRYDSEKLAESFRCFIYKQMYPKAPYWLIADRLGMDPEVTVRDVNGQLEPFLIKKQCEKLRLQVTRALDNADRLIDNLMQGDFPSHAQTSEDVRPFGLKAATHSKYTNATVRKKNSQTNQPKDSPWHEWLKSTFKDYLHAHIAQKARSFCGFSKTVQDNKRLDDFASGHSHLW